MEYHLKKLLGNVGTWTYVTGYQSTALLSTRPSCIILLEKHDGLVDGKAVDW